MPRILLLLLLMLPATAPGAAPWFSRVLVTNDDGIDDPRLQALARAFAEVAEVVVIAPSGNCSGSSNYCSVFQQQVLTTEPRELGAGIIAYAVDGFPGDCVLLALEALMKESPPDLVVSGINSGPNLADAWIASGTIGTVRLAANYGYRAIAFSGLDARDPRMMTAAARWCVALAASAIVRDMAPPQYLSVNLPQVAASDVAGVVWAPIGRRYFHDDFIRGEPDDQGRIKWTIDWWLDQEPQAPGTDVERYRSRYVTVTPLWADDTSGGRRVEAVALPDWRP